jgi:large repetitive protein
VVSWSPVAVDVPESDSDVRTVKAIAHLSAASGRTVVVTYDVGGTASAGSDHDAASGTITFKPGETERAVRLHVLGDNVDEPDETAVLTLHGSATGTVGDGVFAATIVDDDPAPAVTLTAADGSIAEGGSTTSVTAHLHHPSSSAVTVHLAFGGNATAADDYTRSSDTIVVAAGQTSGSVTIAAVDDALDENEENVKVEIESVTNGAENGQQSLRVAIVDDDAPPTLSFEPTSRTLSEGNTGSKEVTATLVLSAPSGRMVSVPYGVGGTATPQTDHTAVDGNVQFAVGATRRTIRFNVLGDTAPEATESVVLTLGDVVNAAVGAGTHTTTITNDD